MKWLDLFSGIGGFALGLEWAGFPPPVAFCEQDEFCRRVLRKHWPDVPIFDDVRDLTADAVGPVQLIAGGFPCQPWSVAGQRGGAADDRDLWPEMRRLVAAARPRWVLGENVPGIVGEPLGLDRVLSDLDDLGYSATTFGIPACAVDAPHRRERVWIVAHADDGGRAAQPRPGQTLGGWPAASHGRGGKACDRELAHALGPRLEVRPGEPRDDGAQRETAERGGGLGNAVQQRRQQVAGSAHGDEGSHEGRAAQQRHELAGAGEGCMGNAESLRSQAGPREPGGRRAPTELQRPSAWSDAEWLHCAFDGKARRVKPGVRLLVAGLPNRVARLRALGNSVVPQVVEQIGRAILMANRSESQHEVCPWRPWSTAPKNGSPIVALRADFQVFKVSWGRDCEGDLNWCTVKGACIGMRFIGWMAFDRDSAASRHREAMEQDGPPATDAPRAVARDGDGAANQ